MNRRDFLKFSAAVPAVAAVPSWLEPLPAWGASIINMLADNQALINGAYYSVVMGHEQWMDILFYEARWTWQSEYQDWRKFRRRGEQKETFDELLERVRRDVAELLTRRQKALEPGMLVSYRGVLVHESNSVPFTCQHDGPPCEFEFHPQGHMTVKSRQ